MHIPKMKTLQGLTTYFLTVKRNNLAKRKKNVWKDYKVYITPAK